ncbi:MAG: cytochrome b/b6 domain-containing protein [Chromatiales bacterium]|jgi:hypothetical protein|nr:cytochrome b/b6 domain-containing protein [Chromatiales bacterium]
MHESFLVYRNFRHLKLALALCVVSVVLYAWHPFHEAAEPRNGGTWLGYTLGTIGAAIIFWLTWFGARKRSYNAASKLQGWLSAHVYLGGSLIIVATLHTGFQFAWNVHTLAYVLMVAVILSGFYGIYAYARYPALMTANRGGETLQSMLDEIAALDSEAITTADNISAHMHEIVVRSVERTKVGGGMLAQLTGSSGTESIDNIEKELEEMHTRLINNEPDPDDMDGGKTMLVMAKQLSKARGGEQVREVRHLLGLLTRQKSTVERVRRDIQYKAVMDLWLYIHVPITFALLAALITHIISVFLYW